MRFDSESGKIRIALHELVSTARRGICPTLPYDEDEPRMSSAAFSILSRLTDTELSQNLSFDFEAGGYSFLLTGRADEIFEGSVTLVREIDGEASKPLKSEVAETRGEGYVLAKMLAEKTQLKSIRLKLIYVGSSDGESAVTEEIINKAKLDRFFDKCVSAIAVYALPEVERVTERLPSLSSMKFPFPHVREGQREFVRSSYRVLARGGALIAEAPTGTGKTVSAIFPALKALGDGRVEKIFYFTPKATTARAAIDCLCLMAEGGAKIKAISISAKEKCCKHRLVCREDVRLCENSKNNKLSDAVLALYRTGITVVESDTVDEYARLYKVCPYELQLAYSEICDVVILDFNYLFDPVVYIRRFFTEGGKFAFLVDEAHNLTERTREMYSAEITDADFSLLIDNPLLGEHSHLPSKLNSLKEDYLKLFYSYLKEDIREDKEGKKEGATHLSDPPSEVYTLFAMAEEALDTELSSAYLAKDVDARERIKLIKRLFYKVKKINSILSVFDCSFKLLLFYEDGAIRMKLFCLDTASLIKRRTELGHGTVFFSATLSPIEYYRSTLGADGTSESIFVNSPFTPEQLSVSIMDKISTRYSERERTLPAILRVIAATLSAKRGNYMIFSPSFEYSEMLYNAFRQKYPKLNAILQTKNMTAKERDDFLLEFEKENESYVIGFCVMGGIYAEGIDLIGDSLIGAIIVGIGMPSISYEREAMCEYFNERYDEGKLYAYVYPGMNRVLQAAGRVIRREDDRGVIVLIDDRFDDPVYKKVIPGLWKNLNFIADAKQLREELDSFWQQ